MLDEYTLKLNSVRRNNFWVLTFIAIHAIIASWLVVVFCDATYIPLYMSVFICWASVYLLMCLEMEVCDMALYSKPDRPTITAEDVLHTITGGTVAAPLEDHMALFYFSSAKYLFAVELEPVDNKYNITVRPLHFQNISRICRDFKALGFDLESCRVSICSINGCSGYVAYVPRRYMEIRNAM